MFTVQLTILKQVPSIPTDEPKQYYWQLLKDFCQKVAQMHLQESLGTDSQSPIGNLCHSKQINYTEIVHFKPYWKCWGCWSLLYHIIYLSVYVGNDQCCLLDTIQNHLKWCGKEHLVGGDAELHRMGKASWARAIHASLISSDYGCNRTGYFKHLLPWLPCCDKQWLELSIKINPPFLDSLQWGHFITAKEKKLRQYIK